MKEIIEYVIVKNHNDLREECTWEDEGVQNINYVT